MNSLVEVRDLRKSYRSGDQRLEILTGLCLSVEKGEMVAVTGVSGSGKSTLLHLLGGMDRPDQGSIMISGRDLTELEPAELSSFRNRTVGFVFQSHHLVLLIILLYLEMDLFLPPKIFAPKTASHLSVILYETFGRA